MYRCPGNDYKNTITAKDAEKLGCKRIEGAPVTMRGGRNRQAGQAAVELVAVLPVLAALLFGLWQAALGKRAASKPDFAATTLRVAFPPGPGERTVTLLLESDGTVASGLGGLVFVED